MRRGLQFLLPLLLAGLLGLPQGVSAQAPADHVEVIIAIDASGSMRPVMDTAKAAANDFVASMPADVRIGVETFADEVAVLTPPTTDRDLLRTQIDSIVTGEDTALYDVVVAASGHFTPTVEHKVLVLVSDGADEGSTASLFDAVAASDGLLVEAISLTTAQTDVESLTALGTVTPAGDPSGLSAAFARITGLLVEVLDPVTSTVPTTTAAPPTTVAPTTVAPTTVVATAEPADTAVPAAAVASPEPPAPDGWLWLGAVGVFAALFLLGVLFFPRDRVSKARLGVAQPRRVSDLGTRTVSAVDEALERHGKRLDLDTTLAVADISVRSAEFVASVAVAAVVAGLVGLVFGGPLAALIVPVVVCLAVSLYVHGRKTRRQAAFAEQLPQVLQLVTTALRSGFGLTQAIESVAEEAEEPARSEFAHVLAEVRMGRDLSESMHALAERMQSTDLEWVVSAIDINRETGGNLSEVLHNVGATIRERGRLTRQVRTLTAEGRLSARVLMVMPLLLLAWQWRVNPDNFALLTEGAGLVALVVAGLLLLIGAVWVRNVVKSVAV